ncbi:hypothetical protein GCM10022259_06040 [Aquimarina mytili]
MLIHACKTTSSPGSAIISDIQNIDLCPEAGKCDVRIHKNSSLTLKKDITDSYYPVIETGNNIIIVFEFSKKGPEGTADGDYSETIHFEVNENVESLHIKNEQLSQVNMLFGKQCFCRGEAGYYKVKRGNLIFRKSENEITIDLSFQLDKVTHRVTKIKEKIKL